ncbi:MAG: hypothetical protein NVSMB25_10270 [Thermoleophilaceae bacterium]
MLIPIASAGGHYVAAAYLVFLVLVLSYVAIMASKIARMERDLKSLADRASDEPAP